MDQDPKEKILDFVNGLLPEAALKSFLVHFNYSTDTDILVPGTPGSPGFVPLNSFADIVDRAYEMGMISSNLHNDIKQGREAL